MDAHSFVAQSAKVSTPIYTMQEAYAETLGQLPKLKAKYPNKAAVLVSYNDGKKEHVYKILSETTQTVGVLMLSIRKRINLGAEDALFLFVLRRKTGQEMDDVSLAPLNATIAQLINENSTDGILRCQALKESTFGEAEKKEMGDWLLL